MTNRDDDYTKLLAEELKAQRSQILEALGGLKDVPARLTRIEEKLEDVGTDVKAIKAVVKEHNTELKDHHQRITALETA